MIKAVGLEYSFSGWKPTPILDSLHFHWPQGSVTGLLGGNGVGKTTLMHLLAGLKTHKPGQLEVAGWQPRQRKEQFRREVAYVPDTPCLPPDSPKSLAQRFAPLYPTFSHSLWRENLSAFGIPYEHHIQKLSQGEQKKVHLGFVLACRPRVLLLDEPTNSLDISGKEVLRRQLALYVADGGTAVISTHQIRELGNLLDRVAVLEKGQMTFDRPRAEWETEREQQGLSLDWEEFLQSTEEEKS